MKPRCVVERVQRHPTKKTLARRVRCLQETGHALACTFPAPLKEVKEEPKELLEKRPACMTSVHMVPSLGIGTCRCGEILCFPCMARHSKNSDTCVTWVPFE